MTVYLDDMMADLDPARRRRIEDRAAELIAEEMTLREPRKARQLTPGEGIQAATGAVSREVSGSMTSTSMEFRTTSRS